MTRMLVDVDVPDHVTEVSIRFNPDALMPYWAILYIGPANYIGANCDTAEEAFLSTLAVIPAFDFVEAYNAASLPTGAA